VTGENAATEPASASTDATPTKPPRVWHLFAIWAGAMAATFVPFMVAAGIFFAQRPGLLNNPRRQERVFERFLHDPMTMLASYAWVPTVQIIAALLVGALAYEPLRTRLRLGPGTFGPLRMLVASVGIVATSAALAIAVRLLPGYDDSTIDSFFRFVTALDGASWWLLLLLSGVIAPFAEELFYRGALQSRFVDRFGPATGITVTSVLFGFAHLTALHGLSAFVLGAYLGWIAWISGSCRAAIVAHVVNNSLAVLGAGAATSGEPVVLSHAVPLALFWTAVSLLCATSLSRWARPSTAPGS
jgi:membrane protease YdiL (CAAX protease family)